jgi:hypothetical protein
MPFMIGGHPRSGTTMLFNLCWDHPQIGITGEFKCFRKLKSLVPVYLQAVEHKWREKSFLQRIGRKTPLMLRARGGMFLAGFSMFISLRVRRRAVQVNDVEAALQLLFGKKVVGDKYPRYVFWQDRFSTFPDLKRIMIYRDGRDVVSSFLQRIRTNWKNLPIAETENNARRVAERWVEAQESIDRNRDSLFVIRYEEFVRDPAPILAGMAGYLGVDPAGFRTSAIYTRSIGKYCRELTTEELRDVMDVAGTTLERLGYI